MDREEKVGVVDGVAVNRERDRGNNVAIKVGVGPEGRERRVKWEYGTDPDRRLSNWDNGEWTSFYESLKGDTRRKQTERSGRCGTRDGLERRRGKSREGTTRVRVLKNLCGHERSSRRCTD